MAATNTAKRKLEDILTCCLCFELYNSTQKVPKALPCQHTFCAPCLDKYMETADEHGEEYKCPMCKGKFVLPHQGACDLPTNFVAFDLLELHALQETSSKERNKEEYPKCDIHTDKQSMCVCMDCIVRLCAQCMKSLSKDGRCEHTLEKIETVFTEKTLSPDELKEHIDELDRHITSTHKRFKSQLQNKHHHLCQEVDKNAKLAIKQMYGSIRQNKKRSANKSKRTTISNGQQQIRTWQRNTKMEIKEDLDSKQFVLVSNITDLLNQSRDIKTKLRKAITLLTSQKLPYMIFTKTLADDLQKLEMQHQKLKENTSRWDIVASTQCDTDLILAKENPREAIPREQFTSKRNQIQ